MINRAIKTAETKKLRGNSECKHKGLVDRKKLRPLLCKYSKVQKKTCRSMPLFRKENTDF